MDSKNTRDGSDSAATRLRLQRAEKAAEYAQQQLKDLNEENSQLRTAETEKALENDFLQRELLKMQREKNMALAQSVHREGKKVLHDLEANVLHDLEANVLQQPKRRATSPPYVFPSNAYISLTPSQSINDTPAPKRPKLTSSSRRTKIDPCLKCHVHGWSCDTEEPCINCEFAHKSSGCKRIMCKFYEKGLCKNGACKYAHKGDGYSYLVPYRKLKRDGLGLEEPAKIGQDSDEDEGENEETRVVRSIDGDDVEGVKLG
jgi:hypothetical protein